MSTPAPVQANGASWLYKAAAFVVVVAGMRAAESILNPLLLAVFLSVISAPAYFGLLKRGVSHWLALLTVIGALSAVVLFVLFLVMDSIAGFTQEEKQAEYRMLLDERIRQASSYVDSWLPTRSDSHDTPAENQQGQSEVNDTSEVNDAGEVNDTGGSTSDTTADQPEENSGTLSTGTETVIPNAISPQKSPEPADESDPTWREFAASQFNPGTAISLAARLARSVGQLLSNAFLILLTVVFILLEAGGFSRKVNEAFGRKQGTSERGLEIVQSIQHYIVIKTWISLLTGILITAWLAWFGVSYAALWGLLAFLLNFIPNVGSIIAAVPAVLIAWVELSVLPAAACAAGFLAVNITIGNFVEPRVMGKGLGLSPLVVFCSMVFWGWVLGPVGMLLSVPLTMTVRIALEGFDDTRWIAKLMSSA